MSAPIKSRHHTVIFTPSGIRTTAEDGESIYDVTLRAGVDLRSICGGKGLCKRCQIEIAPGKYAKFNVDVTDDSVSPASPTERKAVADGDLAPPRRLACRTKIHGDIVVDVPSEAREHAMSIKKASTRVTTVLNPATTLYMCKLPQPTLADNPSDGEALCEALRNLGLAQLPRLNHRALVKLQPILAAHGRELIAVVRDDIEIIDVWPPSMFTVYGAAIDIGSTSLALYVYDLGSGDVVYETSAMNPQIRYGEDVMSRVSYIMMNKGGERLLCADIQNKIAQMLEEARVSLKLASNQVLEVMAVGNPIMHHLFLGLSPVELGQAPFTLALKGWFEAPASTFNLGLGDAARLSFFPLIGGHVGADTTGAYLTQIDAMAGRSVLLVDIGTNAEIVLTHKGRVAAASSPTGPALEGAEISSGVRAAPGAIERVRIDPQTAITKFKIIGCDEWLSDQMDTLPGHNIIGICGSGIFEVMVELASAGLIDNSGLFVPTKAPDRFQPEGNSWKFLLVDKPKDPIYIKQTDVRAVQLAKAALFAGAQLLSEYLGCEEFDEILLAGAFGTHLDPKYVADIGIIPNAPHDKIRSIGNAAGMGAAMALLNKDEKARIIGAVREIEKLETAIEKKFQDYFVSAMTFPTAPAPSQSAGKNRRRRRQRIG